MASGGAAPTLQDAAPNASADNPSRDDHPPAAAAAGGQPLSTAAAVSAAVADEEPEFILGLPAMVEMHVGHEPRERVIGSAQVLSGLDDEAWAAAADDLKVQAVQSALSAMRSVASAKAFVAELFAPKPEGLFEVTAKSRDGRLFRRGGFEWTSDWQTVEVEFDLAQLLLTDPNLVVKS
jgi:hypothetical protein